MIVVHAAVPVTPERRDEAIDRVEELVEQTRQEPGAIEYRAMVDLEDENVIRFFEQYEDEAALEAHLESDHYLAFAEALPELMDGEPDVTQFEVTDAFDPNAETASE